MSARPGGPSEPENFLERSLVEARADPAMCSEFYRRLLAAEIHVISLDGLPEIEGGQLKEGQDIRFQVVEVDGIPHVSFYSSFERLKQANPKFETGLSMPAKEFLELTRGSPLVLNPGLPTQKYFQIVEIESLLDGSIFGKVEPYIVTESRQVIMRQPSSWPKGLATALSGLFRRYKSVRKAYLAEYVDAARDPSPGLLIAVDMESVGDWDAVMKDSSAIIAGVRHEHEFVDFILYEPAGGGLSPYFRDHSKPFYVRGGLRGLFERLMSGMLWPPRRRRSP